MQHNRTIIGSVGKNQEMIVFYGQGGVGNQLFQYAAARQLANRNQCELVLDPYWFSNPGLDETPRPLELERYQVEMRVATEAEQQRWRWMRHRLARYAKPILPLRLLKERGYGVNQSVLEARGGSYLFGFWQSEQYFKSIRPILLRELIPIDPPSPNDQKVLDLIESCNAVSLHVRRGDYVTRQSASAFHGLCSLDYYGAAIQYVAERVENPVLFVFSDDPEWTRDNLRAPFPVYYVDHNTSENAFQDLRLMSRCQHHVIANSSFSWWGAWLADSSGGEVVAPARWFAANHPMPDLIPARWHRI